MKNRIFTILYVCIVLIMFFEVIQSKGAEEKFKVKNCIECHNFKNIKGNFMHSVLKNKNCIVCHKVHVSKYKYLLKNKIPVLCFKCHKEIKKKEENAEYVHLSVEEGKCLKCHNPHKGYKNLLKDKLTYLCFKCHKFKKFQVLHYPYKKGKCIVCHSAHYSQYKFLLKSETICLNCHILGNLEGVHKFLKTGKNCIDCHDPHGGDQKNLLKKYLHTPYKENKCEVCHGNCKKRETMCFQCHSEVKKDFFKIYSHYLPSKNNFPFCIYCHSPHSSNNNKLLKYKIEILCISCHPEVSKEISNSLYVHSHIKNCLMCHQAHGSNNSAMLKDKELKLCVKCHKGHAKFGHPVGKKVKDPRNGQPITCTTCHNPMGTDYKNLLRLNGDRELCVECHKGY